MRSLQSPRVTLLVSARVINAKEKYAIGDCDKFYNIELTIQAGYDVARNL